MSDAENIDKGRFARLYEDVYTGASEWRTLGAIDKAKNIVALCSALPHDRIVEVGAGDGAILQRLSELGFGAELTALELSHSAVETIRRRKIPTVVDTVEYDGSHFPFPPSSFDLAIMSHVLEHVEEPRLLLYEAARVAQFVFVEVPAEDTFRLEWDHHDEERMGHINLYSPTTIRRLCQTCGFEVIAQRLSNTSKAVYRALQKEPLATIKYVVKETALRLMPGVASHIWTYNASLAIRKELAGGAPDT